MRKYILSLICSVSAFVLMAMSAVPTQAQAQATSSTSTSTATSTSSNTPQVQWSFVSSSISQQPGVPDVASSSVTGTIVLQAKAIGGNMIRPRPEDFNVVFSDLNEEFSVSNQTYSHTSKSVTVSPNQATIGSGETYTVRIVGTLYSSLPELCKQRMLMMIIKDIDYTIGGRTVSNQTSGIKDFITDKMYIPVTSPSRCVPRTATSTNSGGVIKPSITVIYPTSGQEYRIGDKINVLWQSNVMDATYQYILLENTAIKNLGIIVTNNMSSTVRSTSFVFSRNTLNSLLANSGGLTEEQLRDRYYVRVVTIKKGLIFNSAVAHNTSGIFSVISSSTGISTSTATSTSSNTPQVQWSFVSSSISQQPGVPDVASSSVTGTIVLQAKAIGGNMIRPRPEDFNVVFRSLLGSNEEFIVDNQGYRYAAKSVTVSPGQTTISSGATYTVTIVGTLYSSLPELCGTQPLIMVIKDIDYTIGGRTVSNETPGKNFATDVAPLIISSPARCVPRSTTSKPDLNATSTSITLTPSVINKTIKLGESIDFLFIVNEANEMTKGSWDRWFIGKGDFPPGLTVKQFGAFSGQLIGKPTKAGSFTFMINAENTGTGGSTSALVNLTVTASPAPSPSPLTATCTGSDMNNLYVQWTAVVRGGTGVYEYQWSVYNDVASYVKGSTQSNSFVNQYRSTGAKEAVVIVTDGKTRTSANCRVSLMMRAYPTISPSPSVSSSPSPAVSAYPYSTTSASPTVSPAATYSPSPTVSPSPTYSPAPSVTVISSPSPSATVSPTASPTYSPSPSPTYSTSPSPSSSPTSMIGSGSYQEASIWDAIKEAFGNLGW